MSDTNIDRYRVTKANPLICAVYDLNRIEQLLILVFISQISPTDNDFQRYSIKAAALIDILKIDRDKYYRALKNITFALFKKPFYYIDEKETLVQLNWFAELRYEKKGIITYCFAPSLKPFLLNLKKNFTTYCLGYALRLKSKYSIRIYEILKKEEYLKKVLIKVDDLKRFLNISDGEYHLYGNLKRRVLDIAQNEINDKTDISFKYEELKDKKRVVALAINIQENTGNKLTDEPIIQNELNFNELNPYRSKLLELGLTEDQISIILESKEESYVVDKIRQTEYVMKHKPETIKGTGKYLYNALIGKISDDDYNNYKKRRAEKTEKKRLVIEQNDQLKQQYENYIKSLCLPYDQLDESKRRKVDHMIYEWEQETKVLPALSKESTIYQSAIEGRREHIIYQLQLKESVPFEEWIKNRKN